MAERKKQLPSLSSRSAAKPHETDKDDAMARSGGNNAVKELTAAFRESLQMPPVSEIPTKQYSGTTATTDETTFLPAKRSLIEDGLKKSNTIAEHHKNLSSVDATSNI